MEMKHSDINDVMSDHMGMDNEMADTRDMEQPVGHGGHPFAVTRHHSSMQMQMWFSASASTTILFKEWKTDEIWQIVLSCVFWFIVAFLYEVLKAVRQEIIIRDVSHRKCTLPVSSAQPNIEDNNGLMSNGNNHCPDHINGVSAAVMTSNGPVDACPCIEASRSRLSPPAQDLVEIQMIPPHGFMATR
ncbi:uncharacterized protein LOC142342315 [Convolutriloba macropyga]|uniref:uncharacterized protein LOC142342315 n=1 Tax=Convolutriloba macropyga TaxID=536237 RepID=UPI003F525A88